MEGDNSIVKSKYDNKNYRVINMENDLQALLVHDPSVATKGGPKKEGEQTKMV
jgi:secreted Zn-dependent insulinase-like peptidase